MEQIEKEQFAQHKFQQKQLSLFIINAKQKIIFSVQLIDLDYKKSNSCAELNVKILRPEIVEFLVP